MLVMSVLSKLCLGKTALVRRSSQSLVRLLSNGFSSSLLQTPPCAIVCCDYLEKPVGSLVVSYANDLGVITDSQKKVPSELMDYEEMITIGASHGWVATLKDDGILRLQDDLNPVASDKHPKRIMLPPLATLPHCQTQIVTNVSMSSSSPEDDDCVVAAKFLGPQLSFCRPAAARSKWTNIRIEKPYFNSSRVMFSKKHEMFRMLACGGHLMGSWGLHTKKHKPKFQRLRFKNLPEMTKTRRDLLHSCCASEHLAESTTTGETFLVKLYRRATGSGNVKMKTRALMVFKLDEEGNALYTEDIGDLCIFLSDSEPFCVSASSFPGMLSNIVEFLHVDEYCNAFTSMNSTIVGGNSQSAAPYHIPPQNIVV